MITSNEQCNFFKDQAQALFPPAMARGSFFVVLPRRAITEIKSTTLERRNDVDIIERLEDPEMYVDAVDDAIHEIERLRKRIAELEAALQEVKNDKLTH